MLMVARGGSFTILCLLFMGLYAQSDFSQEDWIRQHVYTLASDSMAGRQTGSIYADKAAQYIKQEFENIGFKADFQYFSNQSTQKNVIAILEGNDAVLKNEYIVIGAHYDHLGMRERDTGKVVYYPGADDNASGVAAVLDLARMLYAKKDSLKRSIIFVAFDADETGLNGSTRFCHIYKQKNIKLMICLDMVGYLKASKELQIRGIKMIQDNQKYFNDITWDNSYKLTLSSFDRFIIGGSDHDPFAGREIPALVVTTGIKSSPYHKPKDSASLIDYNGIVLIDNYLEKVITNFANAEEIVFSGKIGIKHQSYNRVLFGVTLGKGSNQHYYPKGNMTGKTASAYSAGIFCRVPLNFALSLRADANYLYNNAKRKEGTMTYHSLDIPLSFVIGPSNSHRKTTEVNLRLGGFYHFNFGEKMKFSNKAHYTFTKHVFGLQYGLEMRLYNIVVGMQAEYGLNNLFKGFEKTTNRSFLFNVGFVF